MVHVGMSSFTFLGENSFCLLKCVTRDWITSAFAIEVHTLDNSSQPVVLELPALQEDVLIYGPSARSDPNTIHCAAYNIPFMASPENRLITFKFSCAVNETVECVYTVFMRSSPIIALARERMNLGEPRRIPWTEWGPENTRWLRDLFDNPFVCYVHGVRYATVTTDQPSSILIMEFNSYRIRKSQMGESETDLGGEDGTRGPYTRRLVSQPSVESLPLIFAEDFTNSLPYEETKLLDVGVDINGAFMLDSERLMIFEVSRVCRPTRAQR